MKRIMFILAVTLAALTPLRAAEGVLAPSVQLPTTDGATVALSGLRGRIVLVDFWASWCAPCKASFPLLDALHRELATKGVTVLAVNVDERRRDMDAFLADRPHVMPVLLDPKGATAAAFRVKAMPTSFILDRLGRIRFTHAGYTAGTIQQYRQEIGALLAEK